MIAGRTHSFASLLEVVGTIEIPIVQRDYAQGRPEAEDVRQSFLDTLHAALEAPAGAERLDLDFVYGNLPQDENETLFVLDGQQRLTTLFLLHWYLAQKDGQGQDFRSRCVRDGRSRFTYSTRPGSAEFMDALAQAALDTVALTDLDTPLPNLLTDCNWFVGAWEHDPTVKSCLVMLAAIQRTFLSSQGGYAKLIDADSPRVNFHFLELPDSGLGDDLYIKMNARGKPLTPFENFKAWIVERVGDDDWAREFDLRIDGPWIDFFWRLTSRQDAEEVKRDKDAFDALFLRFFYVMAFFDGCNEMRKAYYLSPQGERDWIVRMRDARGFVPLREFEAHGALDRAALHRVKGALDYFVSPEGACDIPVLQSALRRSQDYDELVKLSAVIAFEELARAQGLAAPERHRRKKEWDRVTANLIANTRIDEPALAVAAIKGIKELSLHAHRLYEFLAAGTPASLGFTREQVAEECRKAALIQNDRGWEAPIAAAEAHWYLKGRVGFLLDFASQADGHPDLQVFQDYASKVSNTLTREILSSEEFLLQRALLSLYDYLLPTRAGNHTFCIPNATAFRDRAENWLAVVADRRFAKLLDAIGNDAVQALRSLIRDASCTDWRKYPISDPEVIRYCGSRQIRRDGGDIYLLSKMRMSGYFAEVRTFALHRFLRKRLDSGNLPGVTALSYQDVYGAADPYIRIVADNTYTLKFRHPRWTCVDGNSANVPIPGAVADAMASGGFSA